MKFFKRTFFISIFLFVIVFLASCGHVHTYSTDWSADDNYHWHAATCEHTEEVSDKAAHTYGDWVVTKEATETATGTRERTCTVCGHKQTETISKLAHTHTYSTDWSADDNYHWHAATCEHTDEVKDKAAHTYTEEEHAATCTENGTKTYTCSVCGHTHSIVTEVAKGHTLGTITTAEEPIEGETCKVKVVSKATCSVCNEEVIVSEVIVDKHTYVGAVTTDPTCSATGVMTYTCANCGHSYTEEIPINTNNHVWNEGVTEGNVTTYTCTLCGETKKVYNATESVTATISSATLEEVNELALKNATLEIDEATKNQLSTSTNVEIKADTVDKSTLTVDAEKLAKIGDNQVYDFTCTADDTQISDFNGKIKVKIPYTLADGEDPANIVIWYLNDSGEIEEIHAKYLNGYVLFETSHFSKYAVVKLTPEEACEIYGHNFKIVSEIPATCTSYGVRVEVCQRCGETKITQLPMLEHDFVVSKYVEATTEQDGYIEYTCRHCGLVKTTIIPKLPSQDNILSAVINSIFDQGFETDVMIQGSPVHLQLVTGEDGQMYMVMNGVVSGQEGIEIVALSDMKVYMTTGDAIQIVDNAMPINFMEIKATLNNVLSLLPTDSCNKIIKNVVNAIFDVTKSDNEILVKLDADKLGDLFERLATSTVAEFIDYIVGENTARDIKNFFIDILVNKVSKTVAKLEENGITVDTVIEFVNKLSNMGIPIRLTITKAEIAQMLEEYKDKTGLEILNANLPESQRMTLDQITEMINSYLNMKVKELVENYVNKGHEEIVEADPTATDEPQATDTTADTAVTFMGITKEQFVQMIKGYGVALEVKLSNDYKLTQIKVSFDSTKIPVPVGVPNNIEINFGKTEVQVNIEEVIANANRMKEIFDLSVDEMANCLKDFYDPTGANNLKFTATYDDTNTTFKSSSFVITSTDGVKCSAYYKVTIRSNDYHNYNKNGSVWSTSFRADTKLVLNINDNLYEMFTASPDKYVYDGQNVKLICSSDSYKLSSEIITEAEYLLLSKTMSSSEQTLGNSNISPKYIYTKSPYQVTKFKYDSALTGATYQIYNVSETIIFNDKLPINTSETKEVIDSFGRFGLAGFRTNYLDGIEIRKQIYEEEIHDSIVIHICYEYKDENGLVLSNGEDYITINNFLSMTNARKFEVGNTIFEITSGVAGDCACETIHDIKISTDGGATYKTYKSLTVSHAETTTQTVKEGCVAREKRVCTVCDRVVNIYETEKHNNEYVAAESFKGSYTLPSKNTYVCKDCGEKLIHYGKCPHRYVNEVNGEYYCSECNVKIPNEFVVEGLYTTPIMLEQITKNESKLTVSYILNNSYYSTNEIKNRFNDEYQVKVLLALEDSEGSLDIANAIVLDVDIENSVIPYYDTESDMTNNENNLINVLTIDKEAVLSQMYDGEPYKVVISVVNTESVQTYNLVLNIE